MRIEVTRADIDSANHMKCPIQVAVDRQCPEHELVIGCDYASFEEGDEEIPLPPEACQFTNDFDYDRPVAPFAFDLPLENTV